MKKLGVLFHGENTSQTNRDGKISRSIFYRRNDKGVNIVIRLSDIKMTKKQIAIPISYSLGSCTGIMIYDPVLKIGSLLTFLLPQSMLDAKKEKIPLCLQIPAFPPFSRRHLD